ncbi:MAG: hypothetical protein RSC10_05645 [Longicatena sp.]
MCNANSRGNCGCHNSSCNRCGERIMVNATRCGCGETRNRSACASTIRRGCGCTNEHNGCGSQCENTGCGCHHANNGCCPTPPRPSCEDKCRCAYRQCMRNCRLCENNTNAGCGCRRENPCQCSSCDDED